MCIKIKMVALYYISKSYLRRSLIMSRFVAGLMRGQALANQSVSLKIDIPVHRSVAVVNCYFVQESTKWSRVYAPIYA
jgi:hypothetical protein